MIVHRFPLPDNTQALIHLTTSKGLEIQGIDVHGAQVPAVLEILLSLHDIPGSTARAKPLRWGYCWNQYSGLGVGWQTLRLAGDSTFEGYADSPFIAPGPARVDLWALDWSCSREWGRADFGGRDAWILAREITLILASWIVPHDPGRIHPASDESLCYRLLRGHVNPAVAIEGIAGRITALDHVFADPGLESVASDPNLYAAPGKDREAVTRVRWEP